MTGEKITFCIATYQSAETCIETIENLIECTSGVDFDILLMNDGGDLPEEPFKKFPNITIFHNPKNMGVGFSLNFLVNQAKTDLVVVMGDDIRFMPGWFDRIYAVAKSHPTSIVSTVTVGLNNERRYITGKGENHYYAAHILFHVTIKNNKKEQIPSRAYIEAKWSAKPVGEIVQVGCALGAIYFCHRDWFIKIRGFYGHKSWGSLEPVLSLRSYIAGGDCILDTQTKTGHLFKSGPSGTQKSVAHIIYNKLLIASTLLPKEMEDIIYKWAATSQRGRQAIELAKTEKVMFDLLRKLGRDSLPEEELKRRIALTGILNDWQF